MFYRSLSAILIGLAVTVSIPATAEQATRANSGQVQKKTASQLYAELRAIAQQYPNGGPELQEALQKYVAENPGAATALASLQQSEPGLFAKASGNDNNKQSGSSTPDSLIPSNSGGGGSLSGAVSPSF